MREVQAVVIWRLGCRLVAEGGVEFVEECTNFFHFLCSLPW